MFGGFDPKSVQHGGVCTSLATLKKNYLAENLLLGFFSENALSNLESWDRKSSFIVV